ncbi:MAG: hypothetical protein JXM69_17675 [Anaerolineae bacterium]|nr:hypothetical protein [Anaerolineae bacterium]
MNTEFFDDPIRVTCSLDEQGDTNLQHLTWRGIHYPIVAVGRQWDDGDGRHVMAEAADFTRFELLLSRDDLIWRVKKVWRSLAVA